MVLGSVPAIPAIHSDTNRSKASDGCLSASVSAKGSGAVMSLPESSSITAWPQNGTWTSE